MAKFYDKVAFGKRLRSAREKSGVTVCELSEMTKITTAQIYNYEAGICVPKIDMATKLSNALDVSIDWLATGRK